MTLGTPYYSKFGFKNITPLIVRENENNYKKKPMVKKNKLIEILTSYTTKNDKKIIELLKKILKIFNDKIIVSDFLTYLFEKAVKKENEITDRRNNGENINLINSYAKIIYLIIKELYIISGYKILPDNKFVLFL